MKAYEYWSRSSTHFNPSAKLRCVVSFPFRPLNRREGYRAIGIIAGLLSTRTNQDVRIDKCLLLRREYLF